MNETLSAFAERLKNAFRPELERKASDLAAAVSALALVEIANELHGVHKQLADIDCSLGDLIRSYDCAHKQGDWSE